MNRPLRVILSILIFACFSDAQTAVGFNVTDVIIYPQDSSLVLQDSTLGAGNIFSTLLPGGTYVDSIRVTEDAGTVIKILANYEDVISDMPDDAHLSLQEILGDSVNSTVQFRTSAGEYFGRLVKYDIQSAMMILEGVNYTVQYGSERSMKYAPYMLISSSEVKEMLFDVKPPSPDKTSQKPLIDTYYYTPKKNLRVVWEDFGRLKRNARVSYLVGGLGWRPYYHLDLPREGKVGKLSFLAHVTNNAGTNYTDVRLRLVGGNIKIQAINSLYRFEDSQTQMAMGAASLRDMAEPLAYQPERLSVDEYEVYDFPANADLFDRQTQMLPIYDGPVEYVRDYVWDARSEQNYWSGYARYDSGELRGNVQNIYRIMNTNRTWPYGTVSIYQDGMLIGQDTISWTPRGSEAKVTVGYAPDIEVIKRETLKAFYKQAYNQDYTHNVQLKLKNHKKEAVNVIVMDLYPTNANNFTASTPFTEEPGNLLRWVVSLTPGQEKVITYDYTTE